MTGFFLKKAFFDGWDNLISMVVHNLGFLLVLLALMGSMSLMGINGPLGFLALLASAALFSFMSAGTVASTHAYANYERAGWEGFSRGIRESWRHALLYWMLLVLDISLIIFVIPFYLSYGSIIGTLLSVILFWLFMGLTFALSYFFPLFTVMKGDRPLKTLKKSFLLVFDNLFFTIFLAIYQVVNLLLSLLLAGLAPGFAGIMLANSDAVKLMMLKYDYMEEHPEVSRKEIPWEELLYEERECVGHRSLKNMIFPWKD